MEPAWLIEARKHIGLKEIPGPKHNSTIVGWLKQLGAWWAEDETPWCGVFVAHCMRASGIPLPKHWYRAKGWLDWGFEIVDPVVGCVVILERQGGGHVFLATGVGADGSIVGVGGNQGNQVTIAKFDRRRVVGYRWPIGVELSSERLTLAKAAASNGNEA